MTALSCCKPQECRTMPGAPIALNYVTRISLSLIAVHVCKYRVPALAGLLRIATTHVSIVNDELVCDIGAIAHVHYIEKACFEKKFGPLDLLITFR